MKSSYSIVAVVYNGVPFLEPLLNSLAAQTLPPDELIVVDNLSTDGSRELLPGLLTSLPFPTRLLFENVNRGYCGAANRGLRQAPGEFVLLLNQDTRLDKEFSREALKGFTGTSRVGMVSGVMFGLMFGLSGIGAAALGSLADARGIVWVYHAVSFLPLLGLTTAFLPDTRTQTRAR